MLLRTAMDSENIHMINNLNVSTRSFHLLYTWHLV